MLRCEFDRVKVGQQGAFVVWGFLSKHMTAAYGLARQFHTGQFTKRDDGTRCDAGWDAAFWPAVHALRNVGIVEPVGMLLDGDDPEAEIIHPYAMRGGEPAERELARAASEAAAAMLTEGQVTWAEDRGYHLVPVQQHISKATLVEIFRLRYRPHTKATGAWYAQMKESTAEYLPRYRAIIRDRAAAISAA
jgi:hypothetical protein